MKAKKIICIFLVYSVIGSLTNIGYAAILNPIVTEINGKKVIFYSISANEYCSPLDNPEKDPVYMRKGTVANNKLKKIWKKVKFNQNKSIEQYTFACDKAKTDTDIYTINFVFNTKDRSTLTVIYAPKYKNAYGVYRTAKCEFIADAFSDYSDLILKNMLNKYFIFTPKEKCIGDD